MSNKRVAINERHESLVLMKYYQGKEPKVSDWDAPKIAPGSQADPRVIDAEIDREFETMVRRAKEQEAEAWLRDQEKQRIKRWYGYDE